MADSTNLYKLDQKTIENKKKNRSKRRGFDRSSHCKTQYGYKWVDHVSDKVHLNDHTKGEKLFLNYRSADEMEPQDLSMMARWCIHEGNLTKIESDFSKLYRDVIVPRYLAEYFKACSKLALKFTESNWYQMFANQNSFTSTLNDRINYFLLDEPILAEKIINAVSGPFFVKEIGISKRMSKSFTGNYSETVENLAKKSRVKGHCFYCRKDLRQKDYGNTYVCGCD
jgi:hypothetical protein